MAIENGIPAYHTTLPSITKDTWRDACAKKRQEKQAHIPQEWKLSSELLSNLPTNVLDVPKTCGLLNKQELQITEVDDIDELLANLRSRKWSSVDVTAAYCKRAAIADQLTNCLTEIFFDRGMARAKELDEYLEKNGKPMGPLHGLPVSLKDQFDIKGMELNMGYAAYLGRISAEDSAVVTCLLKAGAVLYTRTNIPQTLMWGETNNNVYGRTCAPHNTQLTCGGSSGGEGALIALKGSPCGLGTDIGGSVRIPANFNGLFGLRPSSLRVPYGRSTNSFLGQESVVSVIGPLARTASGVQTLFKAIVDQDPADIDPYAIPMPFRQNLAALEGKKDKLCFGLAEWDNIVMPSPPILRALEETRAALEKAGHTVIDFSLEGYERIQYVYNHIMAADGWTDVKKIIDPIEETVVPEISHVNGQHEAHSVYELYQLNREKEQLQTRFLEQWMATATKTGTNRPIDGLIVPAAPVTAPKFTQNDYVYYTALFNILDLPSTVFPVTVVDPANDPVNKDYKPTGAVDEKIQKRYDPELMKGSPVCLQVVARKYRCEESLGAAAVIDAALKKAKQ